MVIKVYYTTNNFSHFDNDYNNTFTVPHAGNNIEWNEINNPRIKWIDNDSAELVYNNAVSGETIPNNLNFKNFTRIKISKFNRSDTSFSNPVGNYIYFIKNVNKQLNGGFIVELELDYWLTYFDLSPFGRVGNFLLSNYSNLAIDRSHLIPDLNSWITVSDGSFDYITNWSIYNTLLSTLERVPFDISKSVDKIIYHNQNFLMCAPGYEATCGLLGSTKYPASNGRYDYVDLSFAMPFKNGRIYNYSFQLWLVFNNAGDTGYTIESRSIVNLANNLTTNFNKTTLFIVIPYNNEVICDSQSIDKIYYPNFSRDMTRATGFLLIPAPVGSSDYDYYVSGRLKDTGAFLIDMPLPNVLGLINDNWNSDTVNPYSKLNLGLAVLKHTEIDNIVFKNYMLGFMINSPDLSITADYLMLGVNDNKNQNQTFKMIDYRYNPKPKYYNWRDFRVGYTLNSSTTDLYLLKGLNNFYFNFKSGFIQYNFQDYEWHRNSPWMLMLFKINLFTWSFGIQTSGFIKLNGTGNNESSWYNNATTPWFYNNATRTSNYSQWIAPIQFNNAYYEFMNTQNNTFNTSLKQMRWQHLTNLISPGFSAATGIAGAGYSMATGAFGKLGLLGAGAMAISGVLNLGKTAINNYFDVEKKNSFLADLNATHNGFTNATGNYNIDSLPSMLQVVINDYMACRLWNWINKYGYSVIDTFNARHINLNNFKANKVISYNNIIDNMVNGGGIKYGSIRFINDNIAVINTAMVSVKNDLNLENLPTKAINWMTDLMVHGISFCAFIKPIN